jgi:hypothetical protein
MFQKIVNTKDDCAMTIVRLVLGVVFFAHGSQKMLGWFGGYGFSGTMGFFTHQMGIPAPFAFLAICAEFLWRIGFDRRIPGTNRGVRNSLQHDRGHRDGPSTQWAVHELERRSERRGL